MTSPEEIKNERLVGNQNIKSAKEELFRRGVKTFDIYAAKDSGTRVLIDSCNGTYMIEKIPRLQAG